MRRKKKIIVVASHTGVANAVVPVIKRLSYRKDIQISVFSHKVSQRVFRENSIEYKRVDGDVSLMSMLNLLRKEKPDLILTGVAGQAGEKDVIEQTIVLAGKEIGVRSLAILDLWGSYSRRFSDIYTGEKFKFLPDKIAILDQVAEGEMREEGFDKKRMVITGNPHFDDLPQKAKQFTETEKQAIREKIGLNIDLLLFFAGAIFLKEKEEMGYWDLDIISLLVKVLDSLPRKNIGLAIKLHPNVMYPGTPHRDLTLLEKYLRKISRQDIKLIKDVSTQKLVLASDITMVAVSTMGVEAVYMGKPCISLQPGLKRKDLLILSRKRIIPVGYRKESCLRLVRKVILDEEYRETLPQLASNFRTDGKATERVVNLVLDMLS